MAKRNTTKELGQWACWLTVLAISSGCAEPPREVEDPWDRDTLNETKDANRGEECETSPAKSEDASVEEPEQRTPLQPETADASDDALAVDGGIDPTVDDSDGHVQGDASMEPETTVVPAEDSAVPADPCDPNPCQQGTCSTNAGSYACACPEDYSGLHCEHKICGSVAIRSRADVESNQECAEILGDLSISSIGLTEISAKDFPLLTKITGDLNIIGAHAANGPHLESVTVQNLRAVEGAVAVIGFAAAETTSSGPLKELHLPAIERIGAHDELGLGVYRASLSVLDLPALAEIEGSVMLHTLVDLCTVDIGNLEAVGGEVEVRNVPRLAPAQLEPLRSAATGAVSEQMLGCCAEAAEAGMLCDGFTEDAREMYCGEC